MNVKGSLCLDEQVIIHILCFYSNGLSVESMSELSADPPAIPKRMALGNQVDTFSKYTPQPLPRVSSLQTARGELPPSVVKIRQRHQNENSGRAVDSNRRQTIGGSSVYPSQKNEDMNYGEGQESELVIPRPPHETPPSARGLRSKRRPLSTCESVCSCVHSGYASSVAGRGGGEGSNVDLCSQCCSCRSSNITLLAENDNGEFDLITQAMLVLKYELSFFFNLSRKYCWDADTVAIKCVHFDQ